MYRHKYCKGPKETTDFLNSLEEKGYNVIMNVISITQENDYYTVFYRYNELLEEKKYNL